MQGGINLSNIVKARVSIRGVRPLLWHCFGPDALPLEKKERTGVAGNDPSEWRTTHSASKEGQLYFDPSCVFACVRDGARYTKKGRGSIQPLVAATLQVLDERILIDRFLPDNIEYLVNQMDAPVYLDVRSVRNPATKARNVRYRVAASPGWQTAFTIQWDKTIASRNELQASVIDAGKLSGLGDGRAIGFGRFEVVSFCIEEDAETQTA